MNTSIVPRPAATLLLVRDRESALEVFMVVRHHEIDFASGALVFPGGSVEPEDWAIAAEEAGSVARARRTRARDAHSGGARNLRGMRRAAGPAERGRQMDRRRAGGRIVGRRAGRKLPANCSRARVSNSRSTR